MNRASTPFDSSWLSDLLAVEVYLDALVLVYPDVDRVLLGERIHSLAPFIAIADPLPSSIGAIHEDLFPRGCAPELRGLAAILEYPKNRELARPLFLPPQTAWVLFDTKKLKTPKWLVRLCELRRITLSTKGRVCVVFNDFVFALEPLDGTSPRDLFDRIDTNFPKQRSETAQPTEISVFSMWNDFCGFLHLHPVFPVKSIERIEIEEPAALVSAIHEYGPCTPKLCRTSLIRRSIGPDD
jgi:hypothetical protein